MLNSWRRRWVFVTYPCEEITCHDGQADARNSDHVSSPKLKSLLRYRKRFKGSVSEKAPFKYFMEGRSGEKNLTMGLNCYLQSVCPDVRLAPDRPFSTVKSEISKTKTSPSINPLTGRSKTCKWVSALLIAQLVVVLAILIWGFDVVTHLPPGGSIILPLYIYPNGSSWVPLFEM